MLVHCLLSPSSLLVLDEAFDGLDESSRRKLSDVLQAVLATEEWSKSSLALITHRREDYEGLSPTHALLLGQGVDGTSYEVGDWKAMRAAVDAYFDAQHAAELVVQLPHSGLRNPRKAATATSFTSLQGNGSTNTCHSEADRAPLVEFRDVSIRYPTSVVFSPPLSWTIREGEKWVVAGGNGSGKSTLIEIITGENMLAFQQDVRIFGRRKGSGESIWEIKRQLGVLSTEFHMTYVDYTDPAIRSFAHKPSRVSTWEVVCSGFFDSIGLYSPVSLDQEEVAREWVDFFSINDLVRIPRPGMRPGVRGGDTDLCPSFFDLSQGQQKLVLLCRAMVKRPRLLLLDEPTHGLSGYNRDRLLSALRALAGKSDVAIVYVTHRSDEVDILAFDDFLNLGERTQYHTLNTQSFPSAPQCFSSL